MRRLIEEIPIEVDNAQKKTTITTSGAYEIMQPTNNFPPLLNDDYSELHNFLDMVSGNIVQYPDNLPSESRPQRHIEIVGGIQEDGIPARKTPVVIFENNFNNIGENKHYENQMKIPKPQPPPSPSKPPSDLLGFERLPSFIVTSRPIKLYECMNCMYNEEVRSRPPFPIYNKNLMSAIIARESLQLNDRAGIENGYIVHDNPPQIWE